MKEYKLYIYAPKAAFVLPFIKQKMPKATIYTEADAVDGTPDLTVMLSHCDIYGAGERIEADETYPIDTTSPFAAAEVDFTRVCQQKAWSPLILRCADIVGTGMTGFTRQLVNAVYRGFFFHFPGNNARRSVVHAQDVANVVKTLADAEAVYGIYNLSDGTDPSIHDLAEAFAFRLSNKRISNLSTAPQQFIGRMLYGKRLYGAYTTSRTFKGDAIRRISATTAIPVCEYLREHQYNDDDI